VISSTILRVYDVIIAANVYSTVYRSGDAIAFRLDGAKLAELHSRMTGQTPDAPLSDLTFVYDGINGAVALTALFADARIPYFVALGSLRYKFGSLKKKGTVWKTMAKEATDLASAMLWKNLIAGLPYQGVKTVIIGPGILKENGAETLGSCCYRYRTV